MGHFCLAIGHLNIAAPMMVADTWADANQRYLLARLTRLRELLEAGGAAPATPLEAVSEPMDPPPALERLARVFSLSPFETDLLLLCAGVELDGGFARLVAAVQGDPRAMAPSFSLALAALPGAHWSALAPDAPLRRWRLIAVGAGPALTQSPLRIEERVLHYLVGVEHLDESLAGVATPLPHGAPLLPSHRAVAREGAALWSGAGREPAPVIQLTGLARDDRRAVAAAIGAAVGLRLYALPAELAPEQPADLEALARLWEREAALGDAALLLEVDGGEEGGRLLAARRFAERLVAPLLIGAPAPLADLERPAVQLEVRLPGPAEQREAWRAALGERAAQLNGHVGQLAAQFSLSAAAIRIAGTEALRHAGDDLRAATWAAGRARARPRLDQLAQRIESPAGWDDLVLPEAQRELLRAIVASVRGRAIVYDEWGYAAQGGRGMGISALFAGPSGTGKTLAAEVLANELALDLYKIDLSQVVSKYIGETEKNLRQIFDAAEAGGAVLLFDEADALFGKRSEVKDSHDRYANIETSYLLQRMEQYRGLAILTTNMRQALDQAFLRRIRYVVSFPFPDAAQRAAIWRRMFPAAAPLDGVDVEALARLSVAGGNIRNIALGAAFLAADAGEPLRMGHLLTAARAEYAKLERPLTEAEVGGWGDGGAQAREELR